MFHPLDHTDVKEECGKDNTVDVNAEKFDTDYAMRSLVCGEDNAVAYDTVDINAVTNNAEALMRKKAYGEMYAVMPMRFPPMP